MTNVTAPPPSPKSGRSNRIAVEDPEAADFRAKRLAFYEACLNGWLQTTFEKDKSILTISSGAIAIVFGVIFQMGGRVPISALWAYLWASVAFASAITLCIIIFAKNARIFEAAIKDGREPSLKVFDHLLNIAFLAGIAFLLTGGVIETISLTKERMTVTDRPQTGRVFAGDSAAGFRRLAPKQTMQPTNNAPVTQARQPALASKAKENLNGK